MHKTFPHILARQVPTKCVAFVANESEVISIGIDFHRWRCSDGELLNSAEGSDELQTVAVSHDRKTFATVASGMLQFRSSLTFAVEKTLDIPGGAFSIAFSHDDTRLAARLESSIAVFDLVNARKIAEIACDDGLFTGVLFLRDGRVASTTDRGVNLYDLNNLDKPVSIVCNDQLTFCRGLYETTIRLFISHSAGIEEIDVNERVVSRSTKCYFTQALVHLERENLLIVGGLLGFIDFVNPHTGKVLRRLKGHPGIITSLEISEDQAWLLSADEKSDVRIWSIAACLNEPTAYLLTGNEVASTDFVNGKSLQFTGDGQLVTASERSIQFWNIPALAPCQKHSLQGLAQLQLLSDQEALVIVRDSGYRACIVELGSGRLMSEMHLPSELSEELCVAATYPTAISSDRRILATFDEESLYLLSFPDGTLLHKIAAHTGYCTDVMYSGVAFSADDDTLITCGRDGTLKEWDPTTGEEINGAQADETSVEGMCLSPDRSLLALCGREQLLVLDAQTWEPLVSIPQEYELHWASLDISFDNRFLAFATTHRSEIVVYDLNKLSMHEQFEGHTSGVTNVKFSPNGEFLVTTSDDETLKVWRISAQADD